MQTHGSVFVLEHKICRLRRDPQALQLLFGFGNLVMQSRFGPKLGGYTFGHLLPPSDLKSVSSSLRRSGEGRWDSERTASLVRLDLSSFLNFCSVPRRFPNNLLLLALSSTFASVRIRLYLDKRAVCFGS